MNSLVIPWALLLLAGCFNKDEFSTSPVERAPVKAVIILEEQNQQGASAGQIDIRFFKKLEEKRRGWLMRNMDSRENLGTQCDVTTEVVGRASTVEYVSGGKIEFSPLNESTLMELTENANHFYQRIIPGSLPDGFYQILVSGTDLVPSFNAHLSLPGRLEDSRINGTMLSDKTGAIKKSEEVRLEWRRPSFGTNGNILVMDLVAFNERKEKTTVECVVLERELDTGDNGIDWTLPKVFIQQLPATMTARLFLSRVHRIVPAKLQNLEADLYGYRTAILDLYIGE